MIPMKQMRHAYQRVTDRLSQAGFDNETIDQVYAVAEHLARRSPHPSEAIRLITLPDIVGEVWGEASNGNEVWAIVRDRTLVTIMLRRSTQSESGLRCDHVTRIA